MNMRKTVWYLLRIPYGLLSILMIGGKIMLANIVEPIVASVVSGAAVLAWIATTRYSAFEAHKKDNVYADDEARKKAQKFAFIPYLFIPILFGSLCVLAGMFAVDIAIAREYIAGAEETVAACAVASLVIYCVMDKLVIRHLGDAVYFDTIEDSIFQVVTDDIEKVEKEEVVEISDEDLKLLKLLKALKE